MQPLTFLQPAITLLNESLDILPAVGGKVHRQPVEVIFPKPAYQQEQA